MFLLFHSYTQHTVKRNSVPLKLYCITKNNNRNTTKQHKCGQDKTRESVKKYLKNLSIYIHAVFIVYEYACLLIVRIDAWRVVNMLNMLLKHK